MRCAADEVEGLEKTYADLVRLATRQAAQAFGSVGASYGHEIGHAEAHEGVAQMVFEKQAPDAGKLAVKLGYRTSLRRGGDVQFIDHG